MQDLRGRQLGKYQVLEEIGRGGMATVYKAYDAALERYVAIKVLAPHLVWESEAVQRFLREARAAAQLKHPAIVVIHDVGQEGENYYFVMEYLEGVSLKGLIERGGPVPSRRIIPILRPLADALDYAHRQGLVHRDIKPANVILGREGRATLTDFGIAYAAGQSKLTATGVALGTPEYMAPEQIAGGEVGGWSDRYALGVVAYEMLSGQVPFKADSTQALLYQVTFMPPPPIRTVRPDLPAAIEGVLARALAKEAQARYPSGVDFVAALERAMAGEIVESQAAWPAASSPPLVRGAHESTRSVPEAGTLSPAAPMAWAPSRPASSPSAQQSALSHFQPPGQPRVAGAHPAGRPAAPPARRSLPGWAWALIGALVLVVIGVPLAIGLTQGGSTPGPAARPARPTSTYDLPVTPLPSVATRVHVPTTVAPSVVTRIPTAARTPTPVYTVTPGAEVTGDAANVRSGPGTEYARIGRLTKGDRVEVIAWARATNNELWYLVRLPDSTRGWVHTSLLAGNSAVAAVSRAATVPATPKPPTATRVPTPASRQRTVSVYASRQCGNQDTGAWINAGEWVEVSASGSWAHTTAIDKNCPTPFGPNGCDYNHAELLLPQYSIGALVGIVDNGGYVVIGTYEKWQSSVSGYLYLCMNEDPRYYGDNTGKITAVITVWP